MKRNRVKKGRKPIYTLKEKKKEEDMIVSKEKHSNIKGTGFSGRLLCGLIVRTSLAWEKYKPGITVSKNFVLRNQEGLEGPV